MKLQNLTVIIARKQRPVEPPKNEESRSLREHYSNSMKELFDKFRPFQYASLEETDLPGA
jgi:hypothetical protein